MTSEPWIKGGEAANEVEAGASAPVALVEEEEDPTNLKRIRERHHMVARLITSGMTQRLVALTVGVTERRTASSRASS